MSMKIVEICRDTKSLRFSFYIQPVFNILKRYCLESRRQKIKFIYSFFYVCGFLFETVPWVLATQYRKTGIVNMRIMEETLNRQCPSWTLKQEQAIWARSMDSRRGNFPALWLVLTHVTGSLRTQIPSYAVADCPGLPDTAAGTRCNLLPVLPSVSGTELRPEP